LGLKPRPAQLPPLFPTTTDPLTRPRTDVWDPPALMCSRRFPMGPPHQVRSHARVCDAARGSRLATLLSFTLLLTRGARLIGASSPRCWRSESLTASPEISPPPQLIASTIPRARPRPLGYKTLSRDLPLAKTSVGATKIFQRGRCRRASHGANVIDSLMQCKSEPSEWRRSFAGIRRTFSKHVRVRRVPVLLGIARRTSSPAARTCFFVAHPPLH
jgi:hypothetical protein